MDALALLSEDDEEEEEDTPEPPSGGDADLAPTVDFGSLRRAGYNAGISLTETDMYRRLGAPRQVQTEAAAPDAVASASVLVSSSSSLVASAAVPDAAAGTKRPPTLLPQELETLQKAKLRDRKRAGIHGAENNRQKNARKMKLGQANFSLKDDRDCVNPFIDSSTASHVKGFAGKRVDKSASVKQISNLSFTS